MDNQLKDVERGLASDDQQLPIDPLRRVFVPIEKRTVAGTWVFRTTDRQLYARAGDGSIRRADKKVRGKSARRADKKARLARSQATINGAALSQDNV